MSKISTFSPIIVGLHLRQDMAYKIQQCLLHFQGGCHLFFEQPLKDFDKVRNFNSLESSSPCHPFVGLNYCLKV